MFIESEVGELDDNYMICYTSDDRSMLRNYYHNELDPIRH